MELRSEPLFITAAWTELCFLGDLWLFFLPLEILIVSNFDLIFNIVPKILFDIKV